MIVVLASHVVTVAAPGPLQWLAILVGGVLGTFTLCEIVRRIEPLRFLLGMKRRGPALRPATVAQTTVALGKEWQ